MRISAILVQACCLLWAFAGRAADPATGNGLRVEFPGVEGEETLVRFPVPVRLSEKIEGFSYAKYTRDAIRFRTEDGQEVPFEIDTWNLGGESLVWVQVPELTRDTALYIRASGDGEKDYTQETGELKMWADYAAVWHMDSLTRIKDATGNGYDATSYVKNPSGKTLSLKPKNRLGSSVYWPKDNTGYIGFQVPTSLYSAKLSGKTEMSVEAVLVMGPSADSGSFARIFQCGNEQGNTAIRSQRSNTKNDPSTNKGKGFMTTIWTKEAGEGTLTAGTPHPVPNEYACADKIFATDAPAFHGMSYDGERLDNFTGNAEELLSLTDESGFKGEISRDIRDKKFTIGCRQDNNTANWYDSEIDELRIAAKARSAAWMENCRRAMLHAETFVAFKYVSGQIPIYNVPAGETNDVSAIDWAEQDVERIIVDGKGTLTMGSSFPVTVTLRGNNTIQIDDTASVSPRCNFAFEHDEASLVLDVLIPSDKLQDGNPIEVLTGTSLKPTDDSRVTGLIRIRNDQGEVSYATAKDIKVSIHNGNVYLTYGTTSDFEIDVENGRLVLNASGEYDLSAYDFEVRELVVNAGVTILNFSLGNDLAGRTVPDVALTLGEQGLVDLHLASDDNYFVGQEACLFSSVNREDDLTVFWSSTGEEVCPQNAAANDLAGAITNESGRVLFRAKASANPLIDIRDYETSFVIDFPGYDAENSVLTNAPVGIVFSNAIPGFNSASVQLASLRFADEFGNDLPYEVEGGGFNAKGELIAWVRLPYLRKGMSITACVRASGGTAPVFEGDRAMCAHPLSTDAGFDPQFARVRFNPALEELPVFAPAGKTVDVSAVDFSAVGGKVVKKGPGAMKFGASVPQELEIVEGEVQFSSGAVPKKITVSDGVTILDLPMGNHLADNESVLEELEVKGSGAKVEIDLCPSEGLYVGQIQEVVRKITGDDSHVTVKLSESSQVEGKLTKNDGRVMFTCTKSEVPLVNGSDYWGEMTIAFPRHTTDEVLTNFPVAVRFSESIEGFRYRSANLCETLRFADAAGNDLPYEIDGYDEKGTTLVWVMVPYFQKVTQIKAYWGLDPAKMAEIKSPTEAHRGARAPFHNYAAVWHMDVKGDRSIADSTQNGFDLQFFGASADGFAFGSRHIGNAVTWPAVSSGNGWAVRNGLYEKKLGLRGGLSTEVIASSSPKFKSESVLICTTRASNFNHGYLKVAPGVHGASRFHVTHTAAVDEHLAATEWDDSGFTQADRDALANHAPVFFGGVFDGTAHRVSNYFNLNSDFHAREEIDVMPLIAGDVSDVRIGAREGAVDYDFQGGMIDEVRISNRARSPEWMRQVYHTFFDAGYATCTVVRDGTITIPVAAGETLDRTQEDYDTRVVRKTGAGTLVLGSAPDILRLDEGRVEFTRTAKDDLPFEVTVSNGTTLAGLVLAPTNVFPSVVKIADGAKWKLVLNPPDLLWEGDIVTVIPKAEGAVAANVTVSLSGPLATQMQIEPVVDALGAIRVRVTKSPRGLQKWSTYTHMMTIYFNGYKELETLENFPALVRLSNAIEGFAYGQFVHKPTDPVFDLRFADYQGNEIPYEIDTWDENGESLVWVSVPKLQAGGRILMYWGLAKETDEQGNERYKELLPTDYTGEHGVWKEYDVVYHFNDVEVKDQTENHNDPVRYGWQDKYFRIVPSAVGRAIYFATNTVDGSASRRFANCGYILRDYYQNWMLGATNHTVECIATMSKALEEYSKILSATRALAPGEKLYTTANYLYRLTADPDLNGMWGSFVYTKDGPASNGQRWYKSYWTPNGESPRDLDVSVRVPVFMGCVFDGENREYTDYTAGRYATRPIDVRTILGESTTGYDPVSIGFRYGYSGQAWCDNMIDEFRMCRKARSPAWMNAVNMNALRNGEFCLYSVEGAHGNGTPIINSAVVDVNAAGATLLVTLPNAGVVNETRMGEATIYGKVWRIAPDAEAEPAEWEEFGVAQEGHYICLERMIYKPSQTYRAVVYARATASSGVTLESNVETNDFTTLSRGIEVDEGKTTGDTRIDAHHARIYVTGGDGRTSNSKAALTQPGYVEMLVVGAGGSGGQANAWGPGSGGGAGGLFYRPAMWLEAGQYAVSAAGPTASGAKKGGDSYFGLGVYQVSGGGRGMGYGMTKDRPDFTVSFAEAGGSGGGGFSSDAFNMTMGTGDQGFWGGFPAGTFQGKDQAGWRSWAGAGGGGATMDGESSAAEEDRILGDAGQGGEGRVICITGREEFYGGGGGGGIACSDDNRAGEQTYAGGGAGGDGRHVDGFAGRNGTGGGGGGGAWYPGNGDLYPASSDGLGGAGGSGAVIWRYTPIPDDKDASPVVVFSEIRGDACSATMTIPVICLGTGKGEKEGTYSIVTNDLGNGHYKLTRTDQVCTLYFRYGVDRFNLDHEVLLTDKAHFGEHSFKVTGLLRDQAYWGRICAVDGVGHEFQTRELPFETTDEGDDSAVDAGYPRLGGYTYVTTNGHEVVFTGEMLTEGLYDIRLYLATNVNDLVCKSGDGAWNGCYSVTLDTATNGAYTIRANDLVPGTRYWYMIEAADADPAHEEKPTYKGLLQWHENDWSETIPMKDRTHHQYTTFVTPREANLSRTYREERDFENAEDAVPVEFGEVLKETGSLPAQLEFVITQVNEVKYAEDNVVAAWPLAHNGDPADGVDQDGGCGLYQFATNFPYGTMVKYIWRVRNVLDGELRPTDQVGITSYVGNPNLFYWVRPSSAGAGDWWDATNWHNPNENYKDAEGRPLPLHDWPLPGVGSTVIFTNMVDGARVNVTGRCDVLRVNLSIGTNRVTFVGRDVGGIKAELAVDDFMLSGSGSSLTFDNLKVPYAEGDFTWFDKAHVVADGEGTRTVWRDVDEAYLTVTNGAELVLGNLTFAPLAGELKVCDGAVLSVSEDGYAKIGGGTRVTVSDATFRTGAVHLEHFDRENPGDPRRGRACSFDFYGKAASMTVEHVIGNRWGETVTPFTFHVPLDGFAGPVVSQTGRAGLSAFGFGFSREETMGPDERPIVVEGRGTGPIEVRVAEDSPVYRSVRTVNPTLVRATHGFWTEIDPYVKWWAKEYHDIDVIPRTTVAGLDRGWRRTNGIYFDPEEEVSGNYGPTLVKARLTGRQRTVLAVEAHGGEVVHRRGVVSADLADYPVGAVLPEADAAKWSLEEHAADAWNDSYVRLAEEAEADSRSNRELYVGVDEGLLGMTVIKNMDAFSTYVDMNVKVTTAWTANEPIDYCDKAKIAVTFDNEGRLCVISGAIEDPDVTVTNVTDFATEDGADVRIVIQAARNVGKKEYFKVFANGQAVVAADMRDAQGAWLVPDARDGKVFPARTVGKNPIGMGKVGLNGAAVLRDLAVGARPPAGYVEALTYAAQTPDGTRVPMPYSYIDAVRTDNTTAPQDIAAREWKNGCKLWASYALGLDPTDEASVFWTNGRINADNPQNYLMSPENVEPPEGSLAEIGYKLQYSGNGSDWENGYTLSGDEANFLIVNYADKTEGAVSYVRLVATVAGTEEIPSANTFGAMKVDSPREKTVVAVPWVRCDRNTTTNAPIALSEYVSTADLDEGDYVLALDEGKTKYLGWVCRDGKWVAIEGYRADANGGVVVEIGGEPETVELPRGTAVWLVRKAPTAAGRAKRFHLVGQVPAGTLTTPVERGGAVEENAGKANLLANPSGAEYDFSGLTEGVSESDQIFVPQDDGSLKLFTFNGTDWGTSVMTTNLVNGRIRVRTERVTTASKVPAGHGFWYVSHGGAPVIDWRKGK